MCFLSCDDDDMNVSTQGPIPVDVNVINQFNWEAFIDESTVDELEDFSIRYPVIQEDLVVYSNSDRNGFTGLDRITGFERWNNYDQMDLGLISEEPTVVSGTMHLANENTFKSIDLQTGAILNDLTLNLEGEEELSETIGVFEDKLYLIVEEPNGINVTSEWLVGPLNNPSAASFVRFNQDDVGEIGKPVFHVNSNNEVLMIYSSSLPRASIRSYNLTTDQIEWQVDDFDSSGQVSNIEIDEGQIYVAVGLSIMSLDSNTGEEIWSQTHFLNDLDDADGLVLDANRVYAVGSEVYIIERSTGELVWSAQGFEKNNATIPAVRNGFRPIIYQGNLYFSEMSGLLIWVNLDDLQIDYFEIPSDTVTEIDGDPVRLDELDFRNSGLAVSSDGIIFTYDRFRFLSFETPMF